MEQEPPDPSYLPQYSVVRFFIDDTHEYLKRFVPCEEAIGAARDACRSVGAQIGTTQRVIVTDGGDFTVMEWTYAEGVTFPAELAGRRFL